MKSRLIIHLRLLLVVLCATTVTAHAQWKNDKALFCSPGVTLGYTFGAKMNFGFVIDAGIVDQLKNGSDLRYGLSYCQYYVFAGRYVHRLRATSLMCQTDFADVKIGVGRAKNKWGYGNHNRCKVHGINFDVSFSYPNQYSPWLGFRRFVYPPSGWAWFMQPYNSVYIEYKYDVIQNTDLKETVEFK